jgi:hypothetical protein
MSLHLSAYIHCAREICGYREFATGWVLAEMDFDSCGTWGKYRFPELQGDYE